MLYPLSYGGRSRPAPEISGDSPSARRGYQPTVDGMQSGRGADRDAPLVLVCDDTEPIRRLLRINLELAGFRRRRGGRRARGDGAPHRPRRQRPTVIVLDSQMSPYDGWWAIAAIRSHPRLDPVPVVLLTAAVIAHDDPAASDAGFDAFVTKPFDPDELVAAVSRLAERGRGGPAASIESGG